MVGLNPIETTLTLTLTSVKAISEKSWPCLIWLKFIYLQTDHIMSPSPDFEQQSRFRAQSSQKIDIKNRKNEKIPKNSQFWTCFGVFE